MANFKGRRQSSNVQDLRGREGTVSAWQVQQNTKEMPKASPQVNADMELAAMRDRIGRDMQDKIKGRTRFSKGSFDESPNKSKSSQTRPKYRQYGA